MEGDFIIKTYIVLDESGAMHLKNERYFIIGGFITKELHRVTSIHKRIEKEIKMKNEIPLHTKIELKSSKIKFYEQVYFLNALYEIKGVIPVAIIIDKDNLTKLEASENVAYNFFVKNLIKYLFKCHLNVLNTKDIELRVDNRNTSVKTLKDLETFLEWEFNQKDVHITVRYLDSKDNRDVQMADYVANLFWKKYNSTKYKFFYPKLTKTYISKFPFKLFGKNPSLKAKANN